MSQDNIEETAEALSSCCASCGIVEIDDIKLKECDGCDLVQYCGDECQNNHKSEHEEEYKKRAAELRDELLFKQPESSHWGDCPICSLPLPIDITKSTLMTCCSKTVCNGCFEANQMREWEMGLQLSCPFCRITKEESGKQRIKRIEANDPVAMRQEGGKHYDKGEYRSAFEYYTKAAELGDVEAHFLLGSLYNNGQGVEKDNRKRFHHWEEAAIGGHPHARHHLGSLENKNGKVERAVQHWIIAATQGQDESIKALTRAFRDGCVEKGVFASALRAHKAAVDATKSPQREQAEFWIRMNI